MKTIGKKENENKYITSLEDESIRLLETVESTGAEMESFYKKMLEEDCSEEAKSKAESFKRATGNITKALASAYVINDELSARDKDIERYKKRKKWKVLSSPNADIDERENSSNHFAKGINLYKILLVCIIGSFAGVVVELIWCMLRHGYIESRSGLVYGPFNLLYGAGAVVLTLCLYRFRNRGAWLSFLGGMLVGSGVEYLCSLGQELLIGTRSWDYSNMPFNVNGRICLLYSFFWGFLGVLWIKRIYPEMAKHILKLPDTLGKIITWALTAFMVFNSAVTLIAVMRWSDRVGGIQASNGFERMIDERFPNERMEKVFANMKFIE